MVRYLLVGLVFSVPARPGGTRLDCLSRRLIVAGLRTACSEKSQNRAPAGMTGGASRSGGFTPGTDRMPIDRRPSGFVPRIGRPQGLSGATFLLRIELPPG